MEIRAPKNESGLVRAFKEKDPHGFAVLYKMYVGLVRGIISRIIHNKDAEEDLVQDTMIKIWTSAEHYNASKGRLFTWILNVAKNTAIDFTRSKNRRRDRLTQEITTNQEASRCKESTEYNPENIDLHEIAASLKPELYEAIDVVFFKGYTHPEAAEEISIPLGTLKTRVRTALAELRKIFIYHSPSKGIETGSLHSLNKKSTCNHSRGIKQKRRSGIDPLGISVYSKEWDALFSAVCEKSSTAEKVDAKQNVSLLRGKRVIRTPQTFANPNTYANT